MRIRTKSLSSIMLAALAALGGTVGVSRVGATARPAVASITLTVAYQKFPPAPYWDDIFWKNVQQKLAAQHSNITLKLDPIDASEGDYYTKIDLALRSPSTAPDIVREDSFLVGSDATAGYLAPLDKYLASWPEYKQQWFPNMQQITTFNGHNYGIMNGTDVRLVWYNKTVFKRAGLPTTWQPHSWADILRAARAIKAKVPGVIPMNIYSGVPQDEASTMQGFEMLLYGTKDPLYDYATKKWVVSSKGMLDSLSFIQQVYNPTALLGPTNDIALSSNTGSIVATQLLPAGKLGIAIDGSWLPQSWASAGAHPWPQWSSVMGHAQMPTEFGQAPGYVSLSGGWSYAIGSKSAHPDAAFQVLKLANTQAMLGQYDANVQNIAVRKDETDVKSYAAIPLSPFYSNIVTFTKFRPAFPAYPKISNQVDLVMENVMTGQFKPSDAMAAYQQAVTGIVSSSNVETR